MKLYVAGPMRGYPLCNFPAFFRATRELRELGHDVVNPAEHDMELGFDPAKGNYGEKDELKITSLLGHDFRTILKDREAIVVLPGWEDSKGTQAELVVGYHSGLRFFRYTETDAERLTEFGLEAPIISWTTCAAPPDRT